MIAFEVHINGKKHCIAGLPKPCVVSVIMTWVAASDKSSDSSGDYLGLRVGGLDSVRREHMDWLRRRLKIGDKIAVHIVDVIKADPSRKDSRKSMGDKKWQEKAYVRRKAREFGWKIKSK